MDGIMDGATGFSDLPLAPEGRVWDGGAARQRIASWASSDGSGAKDKISWSKYRRAFMWYDSANAEEFGSYKLPFADVVDGSLKAVWRGVRAVMSRLPGTQIPATDKPKVRSHAKKYYKKFDKEFPEGADMQIESLTEMLRESEDLEECEGILAHAVELVDSGESEKASQALLTEAEEKVGSLKRDGREELHDGFAGQFSIVDELEDGMVRVRAIVAQVDTINANKRLYPRNEMSSAIKRANALAKRGGMTGLADHPSFFSSGSVRDIALRYERFMIKDKDVHAEAVTVPTDAGKEIATLFKANVALEWSLRGYGDREEVTNKKGEWTHDIIHRYVMDGVDVVLRGAANTKTLQVSLEAAERPKEDLPMENEKEVTETPGTPPVEEIPEAPPPTPEPAPAPEPVPAAPAPSPQVNMEELIAQIKAEVTEAAKGATTAVIMADKVAQHKVARLSQVNIGEAEVKPLERALERAATVEEVDEVFDVWKPLLDRAIAPSPEPMGVGIITEQTRQRQRRSQWVLAGEVMDRPATPEEVRRVLVESYPSNGRLGRDNPKNLFEEVINTLYEDPDQHRLFEWATPRGIEQIAMFEAATTTTALQPILPQVLPIIRQLFPMLIPFEIASVQPLSGPTGRIYFLNFQTSAGSDLSDSSLFDSTWADHTEAATKSQIILDFDHKDLTAVEKAIYYDVTSWLRQDMRALHGLDADAELIMAASNEIAREINFGFLDMIRGAAGAGNQTYGTQIPATGTWNGKEWNDRLSAFITKAQQQVAEKVYRTPDWVVAGPSAAGVLKAMGRGGVVVQDRIEYGTGLQFIGTLAGTIRMYEAMWFNANTMLFGFRPPSWQDTGAVFAPYIPLYISPEKYEPSTNTAQRSVSTRYAADVVRANAYSTITIANVAGTDISAW